MLDAEIGDRVAGPCSDTARGGATDDVSSTQKPVS
jgi:hypothetical protein